MATPRSKPRRSAADTATTRLRRRILSGELPAGSALPGERELSETLGVSRLTLRTALTRLEAEGLVRSSHGAATRVQDYRATGGLPLLGHLAEQELARGQMPLGLLRDILELRRLLAVEVLALVAERATREELNALRADLRMLREHSADQLSFMALDLAFARRVVVGTHNVALTLLYNTIERLVEANPLARPAFLANTDNTLAVYEKLVDLLDQRDVERVRSVSRSLLLRMDRRTLLELDPSGVASKMPAEGSEVSTTRGVSGRVGEAWVKKEVS
ncbi:MAG: GntR family transcriptional regulator [Polyangiales bacterium]|nr:FadR family transcriptional regulator [Myxococcales bacterium]MCB9659043.1 FadR family transcriptional regulator [Sandaracinaceae bacterium]